MKYLLIILFFTGNFLTVFGAKGNIEKKTCLGQMDKAFKKILKKNREESYAILNNEFISQKEKGTLMALNYRFYKCNLNYMGEIMRLKAKEDENFNIVKSVLCPEIDYNLFKEFAGYCTSGINLTETIIDNKNTFLDIKKIALKKRKTEIKQNFKRGTKNILYNLYNKKMKSLNEKMKIMGDDMGEIADSFNYTFKQVSCIQK